MNSACKVVMITLLLSACGSLSTATMKLSPALQSGAEEARISGLTLKSAGQYQFSRYSGNFSRSAGNSSWFGGVTQSQRASSTFTLARGTPADMLNANCSFGQSNVNIGVLQLDTKSFGYYCTITSENPALAGSLRLTEKAGGGLINTSIKQSLSGVLTLGQITLQINSVHEVNGGLIAVDKPLGYEFSGNGRTVGAVSLTSGSPKVIFHGQLTNDEHAAVASAALALGLFLIPTDNRP